MLTYWADWADSTGRRNTGIILSPKELVEDFSAYNLVSEDLFAKCFKEGDAVALSNPNRHAEIHGLASYGDLRGATKVLSAADFMVSE
ncbi:hypothetical protein [Mesorhizobium sp. L48C026A00]|uniref:hypothetical protein n=1 Tax=Mesorhizobium sp. L48C026A00 TaxID=1287182 RepID=UPI00041AA8F2|nr:hypothetical protein [Mesorhizobium sp. L48C026A00]